MGRKWFLRKFRQAFVFCLVFYLVICAGMWFLENRMVYPRETAQDFWQESPSPEIQDASFPSRAGDQIHGWYLPCPDSSTAILFCHGNGGNVCYRGPSMLRLREELNCSVLMFDYPGYGKSTGKPSESGCYASGEAALRWLTEEKGFAHRSIILYGESLGGGTALELAKSDTFKLVLLVKTFTSLPAAAKNRFPWLPVFTLMRNRFDNLEKIPHCSTPLLITSATRDRVVPFEHGQELARAARSRTRFNPLEGQDHNDRLPDEFYASVREFLVEIDRAK
jgi:fermentation-respiration switch protein FrsA (DUF1100 family)